MKTLIASLVLLASSAAMATEMLIPITAVIDGDTIKGRLSLPCPLCDVSIRIRDIDSPEKNHLAKCDRERKLGLEATEYMKELVGTAGAMTITQIKWDKFGGRIDAYVEINGIDVGQAMILKGYARFYDGKGPKPDWCN